MAKAFNKQRIITLMTVVVLLIAAAGVYWAIDRSELAAGRKVSVIPAEAKSARLVTNDEGELVYIVKWRDGAHNELTPIVFAKMIESEYREQPLYLRILNVTSTAGLFWVGVGLLAQAVFMARMLVQWAASEKHKRSVVPPMFWWLSLAGASMLIVYFIWRRDIIGVLGQSTGWVVYIRNIMLLTNEKNQLPPPPAADALDEEPALEGVREMP